MGRVSSRLLVPVIRGPDIATSHKLAHAAKPSIVSRLLDINELAICQEPVGIGICQELGQWLEICQEPGSVASNLPRTGSVTRNQPVAGSVANKLPRTESVACYLSVSGSIARCLQGARSLLSVCLIYSVADRKPPGKEER